MEENDQEEYPEPDGQTKLERTQKRERKIGKKYKKILKERKETAGDISVMSDPYLRKRFKTDDDDDDDKDDYHIIPLDGCVLNTCYYQYASQQIHVLVDDNLYLFLTFR